MYIYYLYYVIIFIPIYFYCTTLIIIIHACIFMHNIIMYICYLFLYSYIGLFISIIPR